MSWLMSVASSKAMRRWRTDCVLSFPSMGETSTSNLLKTASSPRGSAWVAWRELDLLVPHGSIAISYRHGSWRRFRIALRHRIIRHDFYLIRHVKDGRIVAVCVVQLRETVFTIDQSGGDVIRQAI